MRQISGKYFGKIMRHFIFLILSIGSMVAAQDLSLADAINLALENNYDIRLQRADQRIAEVNNAWGNAGRFPTLGIDLSATDRWNYEQTGDSEQRTLAGTVSMNWLLFDGFAISIRKSRLDDLEELSNGNTTLIIENTLQSVILSYYNALLQQEKLEVLRQVMELSQDRYDHEQQRHELGAQTQYELLQAQNAFLEDKGRFLQQRQNTRNARRELTYLMGIQEPSQFRLTKAFETDSRTFDLDALKQRMLSSNRNLKNQYITQSLLERQKALAKSEWLPSLNLRAGYEKAQNQLSYATGDPTTFDRGNAFASLTLSWTIFNGGNRRRAIDIAEIDRRAGQISIESMKHSLSNRLIDLYETHRVRKELLQVAIESLEAAELNLQISEEKFRNGAINSFNFRDVQLVFLNAAVSRLDAIYDLIEAEQALLKITGGIIREMTESGE
ncbi:TolC family protein [candidate division KSB1 bacterium]|nr:TolC family protein [candidate division KSB1 bacterium]